MAQVINTNILSLNAQRNLNNTSGALQTSLQRLSSGLRINSAKDDAAGLAISERFTTQIRGLNQAIRNANDGISLAQTGEAALAEVNQNLQRIRELAVQSVNATNSDTDRATLQQEVNQRLEEIDRIASQTSFNGRNVLDGTFGNALFQVGANVGETIGLTLDSSVRTSVVGAVAEAESVDLRTLISEGTAAVAGSFTTGQLSSLDFDNASSSATAGTYVSPAITKTSYLSGSSLDTTFDVTVDGESVQVTLDADYSTAGGVATALASAINTATTTAADITITEDAGVLTFTSGSTGAASAITIAEAASTTSTSDIDGGTSDDGDAALAASSLVFNVDGETVTVNTDHSGDLAALVTDVQGQLNTIADGEYTVAASGAAGFSITSNTAGATGNTYLGVVSDLQATSITGFTPTPSTAVTAADASGAQTLQLGAGELTIAFGDGTALPVQDATYSTVQSFVDAVNEALGSNGQASYNSTTGVMSIVSGEDITLEDDNSVFGGTLSFETDGNLNGASVATELGANTAIQRVDAALKSVSDLRSNFGAIQNRFESTIANLSTTSENLQASRSRILDADFAQETANLTRAQILQQAGISVLAQANAAPQSVLALLQ